MVEKFAREAKDTIPGAKPVIVNTIADLMALRKRYKPGDKLIVIASYETWKEGPGKRAQAMRGTKLVEHKDPITKQVVKTEAVRIYRCPKCGGEAPARHHEEARQVPQVRTPARNQGAEREDRAAHLRREAVAVRPAQEVAARPLRPRAHAGLFQTGDLRRECTRRRPRAPTSATPSR